MSRVRVVLGLGFTALALALVVTLLHSPLVVARTNGVPVEGTLAGTTAKATFCQGHELLPRRTSAILVSLDATTGPRVSLLVSASGRTITRGQVGSGWSGRVVTIPVRPLERAVSAVTVCVTFHSPVEPLIVEGAPSARALAAREGSRVLPGRMLIQYLRTSKRSWASLAPSVARRMGLGRASAGTWIVLLALALLGAVTILATGLVLRELS